MLRPTAVPRSQPMDSIHGGRSVKQKKSAVRCFTRQDLRVRFPVPARQAATKRPAPGRLYGIARQGLTVNICVANARLHPRNNPDGTPWAVAPHLNETARPPHGICSATERSPRRQTLAASADKVKHASTAVCTPFSPADFALRAPAPGIE